MSESGQSSYSGPLKFESEGQRLQFIDRALSDTGFIARWLLGYNYDVDDQGERCNFGSGGIRNSGNHLKMTSFLDDESSEESRSKNMQSPRGSLKTTCIQAYLSRKALRDRNIRILYGMHTYDKTLEKLGEIKTQFEGTFNDGRLVELLGEIDPKTGEKTLKGPVWTNGAFTLAGRTIPNSEPTFSGFGVDRMVTGGHYNIIVFDDLVNEKNVDTAEGIAKVLRVYRMIGPLLENGGILIVNGTRYADGDLYGYIMENQYNDFRHLIIDVGVDVEVDDDGIESVVGQSTFPHITKKRLEKELRRMQYEFFCAQFLNKIVTGSSQQFRREQFQTCRWDSWMKDLSVYFMCDTATSTSKTACHSAIIVVGLDAAQNAFVLDTALGKFEPDTFKEKFFELYMKWIGKVWVRGVSMEQGALNDAYRSILNERARQIGVRLEYFQMKRGINEKKKDDRIKGLQSRFKDGRIWFCIDTMPRTYVDKVTKILFDPEGFRGEYGNPLPDGEIVLQLVRHPKHTMKDWADALADLEATDKKTGAPILKFIPPSRRDRRGQVKRPGQRALPASDTGYAGGHDVEDWYDKAERRIG